MGYLLREIVSMRKINLDMYHEAVHEAQKKRGAWLDGYIAGEVSTRFLAGRLLRSLHRDAIAELVWNRRARPMLVSDRQETILEYYAHREGYDD